MSFDFIYLASQSPRRRELLEQIGVRYEMLLPDETEDAESLEALLPQETAQDYVQRVTLLKLHAAIARLQQRGLPIAPVLCADTTVTYQNEIYGKPESRAHAFKMIQQLQGCTHQVLTAVAVALPQIDDQQGYVEHRQLSISHVNLKAMTSPEIECYLDSNEYQGKAGAYAIQGRMAVNISHMTGSYSGIMGLPLFETAHILRKTGLKGL